ncbi:hypothetical protein BV25DRAFT_1816303 [Artomyces pyxidatus]|uniref:Uncharacterized protein n=1 Tax=Artomyces pyxidatus TaxID=48021 RepID=A0ACB8SFA4_9AGAM|nr:hypothetical protein BV25DRAFT_1816303 [Artomyces pyxidatus]
MAGAPFNSLLQRTRLRFLNREAKAIVDREGRIVVYLAGRPKDDKTWDANSAEASQALKTAREVCEKDYREDQVKHPRGCYPIMHAGYSHGGGPKASASNSQTWGTTDLQADALRCLTTCRAFKRIAGFASSAFRMAAPRLFAHYVQVLKDIREDRPYLKRPFANSVFPTATFNLGPRAVTLPHRDAANVPYGWCAVTALGDYNPKLGGHIYLWELKMVVEFPPGSTILIPSAVITHGNTPIQEGETRQSFTQYCAGSLMRWHLFGLRSAATLARQDPKLKEKIESNAPERWAQCLGYFSKLDELPADHAAAAAASA